MTAIDDLLDRDRDARRRRDEAASELAAVLQALEGLAGVDMLDATQKRELARLRDRPRAKRAGRRRKPAAAGAEPGAGSGVGPASEPAPPRPPRVGCTGLGRERASWGR